MPLTPKVFDILMVLIQNPGRILTKDEMMQQDLARYDGGRIQPRP